MADYVQLKQEYGLTDKQTRFLQNLVEGGMTQKAAYLDAADGKGEVTPGSAATQASRMLNDVNGNVQKAHKSLLHEHYADRAENFQLSKEKVVTDLETIKLKALEAIVNERPGGGSYNAFTRACELQGKAIGMFSTVHHKHETELAVIDTDALIKRLRSSNPNLALALGEHLGVIDGDYEMVEDSHIEESDEPK